MVDSSARWPRIAAVVAAVIVVIAGVAASGLLITGVRVDGTSMEPTLHSGDRIVVGSADGSMVQRFSVVVGKIGPNGPEVVKRVIGLPGDRVSIEKVGTASGVVLLQPGGTGPWQRVVNPAWDGRWPKTSGNCCSALGKTINSPTPQQVPPGKLFLLGDNLAASDDSRARGWVSADLVRGVVNWRVYPLPSAGRIDSPVTLTPAP